MELTYFRGRVALYALLKALNVGPGDNVAIQAFTCIAVPEAISATGALPVYVDIEPGGFNMAAGDLECKLTPNTRAIVVQHTYGIPADMDRIMRVANLHSIPVIEDCCHTWDSKYNNARVGSFGVGSFYSFEWGKPVVAGIGGCLRINSQALLDKIQGAYADYRVPGWLSQIRIEVQYCAFSLLYRPAFYWPLRSIFHTLGAVGLAESNYNQFGQGLVADDFSYRMTPGVKRRMHKKLSYLDSLTQHSLWVTKQYETSIRSAVISHPILSASSHAIFARYPLLAVNKIELLAAARKAHVELSDWYNQPVHPVPNQHAASVCYEVGSCPQAEKICSQVITLPTHPSVKQRDIDRAIRFLNEIKIE